MISRHFDKRLAAFCLVAPVGRLTEGFSCGQGTAALLRASSSRTKSTQRVGRLAQCGVWLLALGLGLFGAAAALSTALPAQVVASASVGFPAQSSNPHWSTASAQAGVGVALPPLPHLMVMWNLAKLGFDRIDRRDGGFVATGFEAWLSPSLHPALSHGPLLLGEADLGRRFGPGLHGFTSVGAGAGWSFGDWVPYVEFRRRLGFHAGRQPDRQILIGLHYVLFG